MEVRSRTVAICMVIAALLCLAVWALLLPRYRRIDSQREDARWWLDREITGVVGLPGYSITPDAAHVQVIKSYYRDALTYLGSASSSELAEPRIVVAVWQESFSTEPGCVSLFMIWLETGFRADSTVVYLGDGTRIRCSDGPLMDPAASEPYADTLVRMACIFVHVSPDPDAAPAVVPHVCEHGTDEHAIAIPETAIGPGWRVGVAAGDDAPNHFVEPVGSEAVRSFLAKRRGAMKAGNGDSK